jgi:hypothetical protein
LSPSTDNFNFAPPATLGGGALLDLIKDAVNHLGDGTIHQIGQEIVDHLGDAFPWLHPDASTTSTTTGTAYTVALFNGANAPHINTIDPGGVTITPESFNWPTSQNNTPAPDTHTSVVDTTVHDAVVLPDLHVLAATVPSIGGYIIH